MIVTTASASAMVVLGPGSERTRVLCLARRDLLRSPCEAFEHVRLSPGAHHGRQGRPDAESAWYVLRGPVVAEQWPEPAQHLAADGDLLLVPRGHELRLQAGPLGAELLCLTLHAAPAAPRRLRARRTTRP
ncbi:hypothetical protein GCM10010193_51080 [Kitasatospora atroaurantiaca]|uniref:Cupin domain-containing protein n=1 Tax=Kitasatospora atroaurantiaca TaxID=285545 RepID=A0A561EY57_9ACTN|nr:hypothetical protein [Kitasatospora atroaurantiaca]TWE20517.1 hypothetical protein FB465_5671 [Kitasatospora atroaurantiaca]